MRETTTGSVEARREAEGMGAVRIAEERPRGASS
jgi:hypothetical protein